MAQNSSKPTSKLAATMKPKRKWVLPTVIVAVIAVVIVFPTVALAYVGFVPVVSEIMQTNKPVDLGVGYSEANLTSFLEKSQMTQSNFNTNGTLGDTVKSGSRLVITPANTISGTFTQEELTAVIHSIKWSSSPVSNVQVRLSNDIIEISGNVDAQSMTDIIESVDTTGALRENPLIGYLRYLQNPSVYLKAHLSVTDSTDENSGGLLHFQALELKVNRFDIPSDVVKNLQTDSDVTVKTSSVDAYGGYDVRSLSIMNGSMKFSGTIPAGMYVGEGTPETVCDDFHGTDIIVLDKMNGHVGSAATHCE